MRRVSSSEASSGVNSHLCGLTTIESARSQPANGAAAVRQEGDHAGVGRSPRGATGPRAPAMSAMAATGSAEVDDVVPIVATIAIGRGPAARSAAIAASRAAASISYRSFVGIFDERRPAEAQRHARLLDGAVRLGGGVDPRLPELAPPGEPTRRRRRARRPRARRRARSAWTWTRCRSAARRTRPAGPAPRAASGRPRPRARSRSARSARASGSGRARP